MQPTNFEQPIARPTPTIEDYLSILYVFERDGEDVIAARLAEALEVSPPTVTMTLKRMQRDGWVSSTKSKHVHLTDAGRQAARSVIRRHMLTEWILTRVLKVPWSRIHEEAHNIEHTLSDDIETRLRDKLDDPRLCPHGNPFPGHEAVAAHWLPLTKIPSGKKVIIRRIHELAEDHSEFLRFLEENGLMPGVQVAVEEVLPFNQTLTLSLLERRLTLGLITAQYIYVEIMPPD